jgi:hypothetical protein
LGLKDSIEVVGWVTDPAKKWPYRKTVKEANYFKWNVKALRDVAVYILRGIKKRKGVKRGKPD